MSATGEMREYLVEAQRQLERLTNLVDDALRHADYLDDEAIDAADRFVNRSAG